MRQGDLQLLVEGLLGIPWSKLHGYHVSLACTTWSWACLSKKRYRTLEGAALDYEAQVVEKLLALTLKAAKDLHKVNGKALITFESPKHGSFKSNAQVQAMLRIEGFWLVELDYCVADETLDGAVHDPADNRQGGVQPKKSTSSDSTDCRTPTDCSVCMECTCLEAPCPSDEHVFPPVFPSQALARDSWARPPASADVDGCCSCRFIGGLSRISIQIWCCCCWWWWC